MAVLVFLEIEDGAVKKSSWEALAYGSALAKQMGKETIAVAPSAASDLAQAGNYGASKVWQADISISAEAIADLVAQAADKAGAEVIVLAKSLTADLAAPMIGIKANASVGTNVVALPDLTNGFVIRKSVFSGKALADMKLEGSRKVLTVKKNAISLTKTDAQANVETFAASVASSKITVKETQKQTGEILLADADLVVSGGRGMKGPENWHLIEDLAKTLGAATGCSKPVSDIDWRPHHEHVGQTGIKVSPNLYIAVGISGAIQHLAGVSSSKVIVVINKDAEAPFFKAADYGIVGDAMEVLPKLTAAIKEVL